MFVPAFLIVVVPDAAPIIRVVAAPNAFAVVTFVLNTLAVVPVDVVLIVAVEYPKVRLAPDEIDIASVFDPKNKSPPATRVCPSPSSVAVRMTEGVVPPEPPVAYVVKIRLPSGLIVSG